MENLMDKLKILTGRKLSQKEMKSVVSRLLEPYEVGIYRKGNQIIKRERAEYATTPNASNIKYYNKDGLLIKKETTRNESMSSTYKDKIIVYDKPGQFIGKRSDRYENLIDVVKLDRHNWLILESSEADRSDNWGGWLIKYRVSRISPNSNKPIKEMKFKN